MNPLLFFNDILAGVLFLAKPGLGESFFGNSLLLLYGKKLDADAGDV